MTEDFVGIGGKLEEKFVGAVDSTLTAEAFVPFEIRAVQEKPQLVAGLKALKELMGSAVFDKTVNQVQNINLGENAMLIVAGKEQIRTALLPYEPSIKKAFSIQNVKIIGGGRYGVDAF